MLQLLHKVKDDEELVGAYVSCNDLQEMIQEPEKAGLPAEVCAVFDFVVVELLSRKDVQSAYLNTHLNPLCIYHLIDPYAVIATVAFHTR